VRRGLEGFRRRPRPGQGDAHPHPPSAIQGSAVGRSGLRLLGKVALARDGVRVRADSEGRKGATDTKEDPGRPRGVVTRFCTGRGPP
jgi:hypothetical protein